MTRFNLYLGLVVTAMALLPAVARPALAQPSNDVSFVHGIGSAGSTWNDAIPWFSDRFNIFSRARSYDSNRPIATIAQQDAANLAPQGTVVVGHSMGGLVAREIVRQQGPDRLRALITIGTPHLGAEIADFLHSELPGQMFAQWISDLAQGPFHTLYYNEYLATQVAQQALGGIINAIETHFNGIAHLRSLDDLRPESAFISTINQPGGARPFNLPAAHYTIKGEEHWFTPYRLAGHSSGAGEQAGVWTNYTLQAIWIYNLYASLHEANWAFNAYQNTGNIFYYDEAIRLEAAASGYLFGWVSLVLFQQQDWSTLVTGAMTFGADGWQHEDGIVSAPSQAPWFVDPARHIRVEGLNHQEMTNTVPAFEAIRSAMLRQDINVPRRSTGGTGGTGGPGVPGGAGCEDLRTGYDPFGPPSAGAGRMPFECIPRDPNNPT